MGINNVTTAQRKEIHQTIADHGGCNITNDDFDSGDFDLDMAMLMDDMLSEMAENASHKDDEGYSFSTNTDMPEYRYEQLLQLAEANKQFKFKNMSHDGTKGYSIYVNRDLGDTSNCWAFGCDIGEYNPFWLFNGETIDMYEHLWKDRIRSKCHTNEHLKSDTIDGLVMAMVQPTIFNGSKIASFEEFVETRQKMLDDVLDGSKFDSVSRYRIPMTGMLKGIAEPVKFYMAYSIMDITLNADGETIMALMNIRDRQHVYLADGVKAPTQVIVPIDYLAYTYKDEWADYICQDLTQ